MTTAPASEGPGLIAFRAIQLAFAARPDEVVALVESIDRAALAPLPALMLVWALVIAHGDLGHTGMATVIAEQGAALAAAVPEFAWQTVTLTLFQVQALIILGGQVVDAFTVAVRTVRLCAEAPGICPAVANATHGLAALAAGDLPTAVDDLRGALSEFAVLGNTTGFICQFGAAYVEALARAGHVDAAEQALAEMERSRHPALVFIESDRLLAVAWVAAAAGRAHQARTLAGQAAHFACTHHQYARQVRCLQAGLHFGQTGLAARLRELAELVQGRRAPLAARWAAVLDANGGDELLAVSTAFEKIGDRIAAADAAAHALPPSPLPLSARERETAMLVSQG